MEDGEVTHKCDACGAYSAPMPVRDYTERALVAGIAPGKFRERAIEKHRKQAAENLRTMPRTIKKICNK